MASSPAKFWSHIPGVDNQNGPIGRLDKPVFPEVTVHSQIGLQLPADGHPEFLDKILSRFRVLIIEGISGSGKDTFQTYLKKNLKGRDVYDFSEGEVLHSWKQLQIEGISELRIKFMKCFMNYIRDVVSRDADAVFLLNRFHLSTYASTIVQHPQLKKEYDEIINILRILPVHVFILQLDENEIEKRSLHPERSGAWQKFQQQIGEKNGFRDRLERQQRLILEAAKKQQIPYSVIKVSREPEIGEGKVRITEAPSIVHRRVRINAADAKISRRKQHVPAAV